MTRIAILGCGGVGRRLAELLLEPSSDIATRLGSSFDLAPIFVRDASRDRGLPSARFTSRFDDILQDRTVTIAVELLGGIEPARSHVEALLRRGVHVVTANKTLLARHGCELRVVAARHGAQLRYEASVCAAIPLLASLKALAGDTIHSIRGILNGSCNFILSRMRADGLSLEDALALARARGLVEPDPSADISGRDAVEKLCVLAGLIGRPLDPTAVRCTGLDAITAADLAQARRWGYTIRHVAEYVPGRDGGASVGPAILPTSHPLASVHEEDNAIIVQSRLGGELFLKGKGAGPDATASAILGDIAACLPHHDLARFHPAPPRAPADRQPARHFARVTFTEHRRPDELIQTLASHGVQTARLDWRRGEAALLSAPVNADRFAAALSALGPDVATFSAPCWEDVA